MPVRLSMNSHLQEIFNGIFKISGSSNWQHRQKSFLSVDSYVHEISNDPPPSTSYSLSLRYLGLHTCERNSYWKKSTNLPLPINYGNIKLIWLAMDYHRAYSPICKWYTFVVLLIALDCVSNQLLLIFWFILIQLASMSWLIWIRGSWPIRNASTEDMEYGSTTSKISLQISLIDFRMERSH